MHQVVDSFQQVITRLLAQPTIRQAEITGHHLQAVSFEGYLVLLLRELEALPGPIHRLSSHHRLQGENTQLLQRLQEVKAKEAVGTSHQNSRISH